MRYLHVEVDLPALVESEHAPVAKLRPEVLGVGGHQVSAQVDVFEHAFQLRRERASTFRLKKTEHRNKN